MKIVMPENQTAVYHVEGVAAALVKPKTWEKLFMGETIGVIEPKINTYTLFINNQFVSVITAKTETALKKKSMQQSKRWIAEQEFLKKPAIIQYAEILPGYPDFLYFKPEKLSWYKEKGLSPEHCAERIRTYIKEKLGRLDSFTGVFVLMDELAAGGLQREGRD